MPLQRPPADLYLDLLKKSLSFLLWPEPPAVVEDFSYVRKRWKRMGISLISKWLRKRNHGIVRRSGPTPAAREEGTIWPRYADTMIGLKRLDNLQYCAETAIRESVPGDFIETGVWRGGACILLRGVLAAHGVTDRTVFVADSFAGLPKPDPERYPADAGDVHHRYAELAVSQEDVERNFKRYGLLDERVVFLKGWFSDTLPRAPIKQLAVLRLDGDMYGSTMDALNSLYPKLSAGGFCIVDDYALAGCKKAVDDFRAEHAIDAELQVVDWTGRYWRK
jgi:O-methyltransferase